MACMTKTQREAIEEAARIEQENRLRAEYPTRLMKALSQATELKYVLSVVDDSFVITELNETYPELFTMSYEYNAEAEQQLYDLELELKFKYAEVGAARRASALAKLSKLSKLSDEERELLGVK